MEQVSQPSAVYTSEQEVSKQLTKPRPKMRIQGWEERREATEKERILIHPCGAKVKRVAHLRLIRCSLDEAVTDRVILRILSRQRAWLSQATKQLEN